MIPNKHLETPHYKLERLRHDDPRLDDQKASYVMAEEAARELETDTAVSKKDADVKVRPEAAVKGITPNAPAPVSQPRPVRGEPAKVASSGGFFGFIKSLFSSPAPEVKPEPVAPRGRNQGRNGDRNNRNGNRGRRGERNDRNGERTERPAVAGTDGTSTEGGNRGRNGNRNANRNQNGPKPERTETPRNQAAVTPATDAAPNSEAASSADGEERRGRGRNRRGRGRGQRERTDANGDAAIASVVAITTSFTGPPVGMAGASATMPTKDLGHSFGNRPAVASEPKERTERAPRDDRSPRAPRPTSIAAPAIEVIAKPTPELPKVAFQALEETSLHSVVQSAGMIWVATDSNKHAEAQNQIKAEPVISNLGRAPKPAASLPEGPMVLVETGGQEKTI